MKKMVLFASVLFSSVFASAANTYQLGALNCIASNGVQFSTLQPTRNGGLLVATKWAGYKKTFKATVEEMGEDAQAYIHLADTDSEATYLLSLNLDTKISKEQKTQGALFLPPMYEGGLPTMIAAVACDIQVKMTRTTRSTR